MKHFRLLFDKMIFIYFFAGILPLVLIVSIFLNLSSKQFSEKIRETYSLQAKNYTTTTTTEVNDLLHQIYAISADNELKSIIRKFDHNENQDYISTLFRSHVSSLRTLNTDISDFVYINPDSGMMLSLKNSSIEQASFWEDMKFRSSIADEIVQSNSIQFFTAEQPQSFSLSDNVFYIGLPISYNSKHIPVGALIIAINCQFFNDLPSSLQTDDLEHSMHNLIVDAKDHIVFCDDSSYIGMPLSSYTTHYNLSEDLYTLSTQEIKRSSWQHYSYLPDTLEFSSLTAFHRNLYFMLAVLCILVFILIAIVVAMQNLRIHSIAQSMVNFSGAEQDYQIHMKTSPVLQEIVVEFNAMTRRVRDLVHQLELKERVVVESLNRQRIAEIKTLEAQINPHFLSNTLNTISWAAIEKGEFEISDMICSIAHLLQYSIRNVDQPVFLSEEIQWLNDYMYLQQKRFATLFQYTINVNDTLLDDCMIYKLLLQPILENSILHAFDKPEPSNSIIITITPMLLSNQLEITISDNGHGIPADILEQIQTCLKEEDGAPAESHIGILSAYRRLHAYYGDAASMMLRSDLYGTTTRLLLPMLFPNENQEEFT
ncbi:MAG: histidine kinase [Eubacteriales bacterium]|nr:histidine kinase [Eubacteriales bacterium]